MQFSNFLKVIVRSSADAQAKIETKININLSLNDLADQYLRFKKEAEETGFFKVLSP